MAQLNDLLVMGQSTLLGPVTIQGGIVDKNNSSGISNQVLKTDGNGQVYWGYGGGAGKAAVLTTDANGINHVTANEEASYYYSTVDLQEGQSTLETGKLYFVYE